VVHSSLVNRVVAVSTLGIFVDAYDYFVMGVIAVGVWPKVFLNSSNLSLMISLFAYLVAFLSKPLGGIVMGHFADVKGRKTSMFWSVFMSAVSVGLISAVPASLGAFGLLIITILRFTQGFGSGGNHGSSLTLSYELVIKGKKTRHKMWLLQLGPVLGLVISVVVVSAFQGIEENPAFLNYGWRLAILVGAGLLAFRSFLRTKLIESPDFLALKEKGYVTDLPVKSLLLSQWREVLLAFLSVVYYRTTLNFLVYPFLFKFFAQEGRDATAVLALGFAFSVLSIFLGALMTFKLSWIKVAIASVASTSLTVPLVLLDDPLTLLPLFVTSSLGWGAMGYMVGEFDPRHRSTGTGLVFNTSDVVPSVLSAVLLPFLKATYVGKPLVTVVIVEEAVILASLFSLFLIRRKKSTTEV